eukprot:COSAG01_NODE_763_length_13784_cov_13.112897_8_plen_375_part_00
MMTQVLSFSYDGMWRNSTTPTCYEQMVPITVVQLGVGFVVGKERVISKVNRTFTVPRRASFTSAANEMAPVAAVYVYERGLLVRAQEIGAGASMVALSLAGGGPATQQLGIIVWKTDDDGVQRSLGVHRWGGERLPAAVDWQAAGALTAVQDENQHGCVGACWAFSAAGALESAHKIQSGHLVTLSPQQFMDCIGDRFGNPGDPCTNGGEMDAAFQYSVEAPLCTNASYPYFGPTVAKCHTTSCTVALPRGAVKGHMDVAADEMSLMSAVSQQPVSVAVHGAWGDDNAFQDYTGGVLKAKCNGPGHDPYGPGPDHGVLLVGYGVTDRGEQYWKIKNSYGVGWGIAGYALLERGKAVPGGECGIVAANASYPVMR